MMLDLPSEWLKIVQDIAQASDYEVLAYGSRVNGKAHQNSDLDLVFRNIHHPEQTYPDLQRIRSAFRESTLPITVDVLDWAAMPDSFRQQVLRNHIVISKA